MNEALASRFEKLYRDNWGNIKHQIESQRDKFLRGESYVCFLLDTIAPDGRQVAEVWDDGLSSVLQEFHAKNPDPEAKLVVSQIVEFEDAKRCLKQTQWMPEMPPDPGHIAIAIVSGGCAVIQVYIQNILDALPPR